MNPETQSLRDMIYDAQAILNRVTERLGGDYQEGFKAGYAAAVRELPARRDLQAQESPKAACTHGLVREWQCLTCGEDAGRPGYDRPKDAKGGEATTCVWSEDSDGNWDTCCGEKFILDSGGPKENGAKYCLYCGKKLDEVPYAN